MREHMKSGLAVARFLENHPCVDRVIHPGLKLNFLMCFKSMYNNLNEQDCLRIRNMNWLNVSATAIAVCSPCTSKEG